MANDEVGWNAVNSMRDILSSMRGIKSSTENKRLCVEWGLVDQYILKLGVVFFCFLVASVVWSAVRSVCSGPKYPKGFIRSKRGHPGGPSLSCLSSFRAELAR
ncbi:hypothetical protein RHMOL_Rhmol06G0126100 [Rhododendron molle]|uniref:Uncharacterized protein n=1 Tax=Rhododendron molle TaxID=49168 RepID=A0ACC0NCZ0_RHOML|nr:hypothetical protein RHMOL_Rhmol06G0126100 [Rhododendron molle]